MTIRIALGALAPDSSIGQVLEIHARQPVTAASEYSRLPGVVPGGEGMLGAHHGHREINPLAGWQADGMVGALIESVADALYVVDPEGRVRFANPAAVGLLGYPSADELIGRMSHETIHYKRPDGAPFP